MTQKQRVIKMLKEQGFISRNYFIGIPYDKITRLGAIVNKLNNQGWDIKGDYEKTEKGKDYVYRVTPIKVEKYWVNYPEGRQLIEKKIYA